MSAKRFNGDILSALSSSALEYSSASGGLHSLSETVYLQSLSLLGLISYFHYRISYIVIIYFYINQSFPNADEETDHKKYSI